MIKVSRVSPGYLWSLALAGGALVVLAIPDLIRVGSSELAQLDPLRSLQGSLYPDPRAEREIVSSDSDLLAKLEEGDLQWRPKEEILGDGTTRYIYKRRSGDPDLTVSELRHAVASPPSFQQERKDIAELVHTLRKAGVRILLMPPIKQGAAAEWDHRLSTLRIQPDILRKGSVDFLQILNHEAVHVAQSCKGGSLKAKPSPLGMQPFKTTFELKRKVNDPIYANASHWEKKLELEAYSMQENSDQVKDILISECL